MKWLWEINCTTIGIVHRYIYVSSAISKCSSTIRQPVRLSYVINNAAIFIINYTLNIQACYTGISAAYKNFWKSVPAIFLFVQKFYDYTITDSPRVSMCVCDTKTRVRNSCYHHQDFAPKCLLCTHVRHLCDCQLSNDYAYKTYNIDLIPRDKNIQLPIYIYIFYKSALFQKYIYLLWYIIK